MGRVMMIKCGFLLPLDISSQNGNSARSKRPRCLPCQSTKVVPICSTSSPGTSILRYCLGFSPSNPGRIVHANLTASQTCNSLSNS